MIDSIQNIFVQVSDFLLVVYHHCRFDMLCRVFHLANPFRSVSSHQGDGEAAAPSR